MNITIEQTNVCNLDCPVCETGAGILGRTKGHMSLEQFRTIIDKVGAHTNTLMFYFMGEPFLNKHAYDMIRYAKQAGIPFIETCTNGDFVDPVKIVASGLDRGELPDRRHDAGDPRDLPGQGAARPDDEESDRDDPRTQRRSGRRCRSKSASS